jgi:hypothetical protein
MTSPAPDLGPSVDGAPSAGGPVILSFGANVQQLTVGETVRFVVVVTLPAGLDKLIGGKLVDPTDHIDYGALVATTQGSYQIDLTWAQINQATPISFTTDDQRTFVAKLYDQAGQSSTASLQLRLYCAGALGACNGVCVDLATDPSNCGSCGHAVPAGLLCRAGQLACDGRTYCNGACVDINSDPNNCGGCGIVVAPPRICWGGQPSCAAPSTVFIPGMGPPVQLSYCAGSNLCVDLMSDPGNCGACGVTVAAPLTCVGGKAACANSAQTFCAGSNTCSDLISDANNCTSCGNVCPARAGATAVCNNGCEYTVSATELASCTSICGAKGLHCSSQGGIAWYWSSADDTRDPAVSITCDGEPSWADGAGGQFGRIDCVCY